MAQECLLTILDGTMSEQLSENDGDVDDSSSSSPPVKRPSPSSRPLLPFFPSPSLRDFHSARPSSAISILPQGKPPTDYLSASQETKESQQLSTRAFFYRHTSISSTATAHLLRHPKSKCCFQKKPDQNIKYTDPTKDWLINPCVAPKYLNLFHLRYKRDPLSRIRGLLLFCCNPHLQSYSDSLEGRL